METQVQYITKIDQSVDQIPITMDRVNDVKVAIDVVNLFPSAQQLSI